MKTIVVVEDDRDLARLIQLKLSREGFNIVNAYDGIEGLAEIRRVSPNLVILDIMMPKMNGFQVLKEMRADPVTKDIPVLILTALTQEEDVVKGFQYGADDYMVKPFRPSELLIRATNLVGKSPVS